MDRRRSLAALIGQHFASFRKSRRTTVTALVFGLLMGRRLGLAAIARRMAGPVSVRHKIKRVGRFADNKGVRASQATVCLVGWVLSLCGRAAVVAVDWTDIGRGLMMLTGAVALEGRAVPVAWSVMGKRAFTKQRKSRNDAEEQLIVRLRDAFCACRWTLVAERGFARASLFRRLNQWGIRYVIRACGTPWVETGQWSGLLCNIPRQPGCCKRYGRVLYHRTAQVPVSLVVVHRGTAPEPWYLVTNAPGSKAIEAAYRRRCWIEEHFRDAKSGLGLDRLRLKRAHRIERLLIVAAVAVLVAIAVGHGWCAEHGGADPQMTSHKRGQSLSVLTLGCELIFALMLGPLPLSLLDRPLPLAPESTP
jgi:hypothetical protein